MERGNAVSIYPAVDAAISGSFAPVDLIILVDFLHEVVPM